MERFTKSELDELLGMIEQDERRRNENLGQLAEMLRVLLGLR